MNMGKQGNKSQLYSRSVRIFMTLYSRSVRKCMTLYSRSARNIYDFVFKKCKKYL